MSFTPRLYGYWRSSASWRVRWAFELKGFSYVYVPVNILKQEHKSEAHLKRSTLGSLPAFEAVEGQYISESFAMIDWVEESHPSPSLYPKDLWHKAYVKQLCELINSDTAPLQVPAVQKKYSDDPSKQKEWAQFYIRRGFTAFDVASAKFRGDFCFQNQVTAADLFLIPQVYNALRYDMDISKEYPALWKIYQNCLTTEACQKASPEKQVDAVK